MNDFTPDTFEEMCKTFRKFDADGSGSIDAEEIGKMLEALEMGHAADKAAEIMKVYLDYAVMARQCGLKILPVRSWTRMAAAS